MHVLSAEEVADWFRQYENRGVASTYAHADKDGLSPGLFFTNPETACIDLEYPAKLEQLPFFARFLATVGYEAQHFDGALIWFTAWGVWGSDDESIDHRIVEQMNAGAGQPKSFEVSPGHQFRADELRDAIGMLLQPMVFGWDCFYLPSWSYGGASEFFLHVGHDSFVSVVTRTKECYDRIFGLLTKLDPNPKPGHELRVRRFCRVP